MANKTITVAKTPRPNKGVDFEFTGLTASDTALVPSEDKDEQTFVIFKGGASAGATVTLKAGNGVAGCNDLTITVTQGKYTALTIDSSRYKNVSGTNKGKLVFTTTAAVDIAVVSATV